MIDATAVLALARSLVAATTFAAVAFAFQALRGRRTKAAVWWTLAAVALSVASVAFVAWTRGIRPSHTDLRER